MVQDNARLLLAWQALDVIDAMSLDAMKRGRHDVTTKPDGTPVTGLELEVERLLVSRIDAAFPSDSVLGEESGVHRKGADLWIIDPIDGTGNYLEGVPIYAHMISYTSNRKVAFSIVSAPGLNARWWALGGAGAFRGDRRIQVSTVADMGAAQLCYGGLRDYDEEAAHRLVRLARRCRRSRGYGNFLPHMLVAEGTYDIAASAPGNAIWDLLPLVHIVTEAGGRMTSFSGGAPNAGTPVLTSNGALHNDAGSVLA
ncbi:inositol monophosphatase family protein [Nocardia brasiliensis]|uniref:inositol monophosphatase family protein n=1 Tax=Nocardia brasiliensis TaxID=37326 RepID=UPI00142D42FB|nr:inositol monophosphatase family protein [Nocardia brasiliensis]